MGLLRKYFNQTSRPEGTLGKMMIRGMNSGHGAMADWGMSHLGVSSPAQITDLGCGGGRNAAALMERYPDLKIAGTHSGFFEQEWRVVSEVSLSGAQVLYVCLGSPKQEKFIYYNQKYLSEVLMLGLGGSLDIYAEKKKRAPVFFRKTGLEWAYRIAREPRRLKKVRLLSFVFSVIRERFTVKNVQNKQENFAKKGRRPAVHLG